MDMKCSEFRQAIIHRLREGSFAAERDDLAAHMRECELCREFYSEALLNRALNEEPVPQPDPEFADRVMGRAISRCRRQRHSRVFRGLSTAAAVLVIFFAGYLLHFTMQQSPVGQRQIEVVMSEGEENSVNILIEAKQDRRGATFTVDMEGSVALKGHPGRRSIQWQTDLVRGKNLLELPIELRDETGGRIRVGYRYDHTKRQVSVRVRSSAVNTPNGATESKEGHYEKKHPDTRYLSAVGGDDLGGSGPGAGGRESRHHECRGTGRAA
jgi:hypothetical protein